MPTTTSPLTPGTHGLRVAASFNPFYAAPTVKQHMAAIRMLFSWLTEKGELAMNPTREVKTERFSRTEDKTPAFVEGEVQKLLCTVETSTHTGLRDLKRTRLNSIHLSISY